MSLANRTCVPLFGSGRAFLTAVSAAAAVAGRATQPPVPVTDGRAYSMRLNLRNANRVIRASSRPWRKRLILVWP